ncbi:MAG: hypothetical protein J3Q66DRAFT_434734 [Benniella sp.]|nr:MAG: hypothetical protein J3Q66DRAFT_434734 [Benniella sp.]
MSHPVFYQYVPPPPSLPQSHDRPESTSVWIGEGDGHFQEENAPSMPVPGPIRLYFSLDKELDYSKMPMHYNCVPETQEVVELEAYRGTFRFSVDTPQPTEEVLNVSIAMGLRHLDMDKIDYISFRHHSEDHHGAHESFTRKELEERCTPERELTLELHRQRIKGDRYLEMKIQTRPNVDPEDDAGFVELHFMTLQVAPFEKPQNFRPVNPSRPMSIDVGHREAMLNPNSPIVPARIVHYSVSGDGNHVATLSVRNRDLHLDVWNLTRGIAPGNEHRKISMINPISFSTTGVEDAPQVGVSVSYDASLITVIDSVGKHLKEMFHMFEFDDPTNKGNPPGKKTLYEIMDDRILPRLKGFRGFGKFHSTSHRERSVEDELFITCDGFRVDIFSIQGKWEMIRSIRIWRSGPISQPWRLVEGIGGKYFSWKDNDNNLLVCDLATGKLVHSLPSCKGTAFFARDGPLMMCYQDSGVLTTRWTETGSLLASTDIFGHDTPPSFPTLLKHGNNTIVFSDLNSHGFGHEGVGIVLDTKKQCIVERASFVDDVASRPYPRYECARECVDTGTLVQEPADANVRTQSYDLHVSLPASYPARDLQVQCKPAGAYKHAVTISFIYGSKKLRETIGIPWFPNTGPRKEYKYHVDKANRQLIIECELLIMVWKLPAIFGHSAVLQSACWTETVPFGSFNVRSYRPRTELVKCTHERIHARTHDLGKLMLSEDDTFESDPDRFFNGLYMLISGFDIGSDGFQKAILQYVDRYINRTTKIENVPETILTMICSGISNENFTMCDTFLKVLFDSPYTRWVPMPGLSRGMNPIAILLEKVKDVPRAVQLAGYLIDYCVRIAKEEKDANFVSPIVDLLPEIVKQEKSHPDVVFSAIRGLTYVPVMDRFTILDRCIIVHPPEFRWKFWRPKTQLLSACEYPIVKMDRSLLSKKRADGNEKYIHDVFIASFDMLWSPPPSKEASRTTIKRITKYGKAPRSWLRTLIAILCLKCRITPNFRVSSHEYTLQMLDNPALAILIEYKWNTIGYIYWLARFTWQCLFHMLVLVAVFMQVYGSTQRYSLMGVFIAIIVMASLFLLLEVQQFIHNPKRYISLPYNFVDIVAFGLPLAASALQIINLKGGDMKGNTSTLSFSVLVTFLHVLFELRVNKNVCRFVVIIFYITRKIRIFFLIFTSGILAFAIAILHLLRACPVDVCEQTDVKFPLPFYKAISATYFFLGGEWDPVSHEFEEGEWTFFVMMMMFFFFTSILLLNVLIALMNVAFNDGDMTWELVWRESRLRCNEGAETIAYSIPGFRENYNIFPEEIYYTATHRMQKDYERKTFPMDGNTLSRASTSLGPGIAHHDQEFEEHDYNMEQQRSIVKSEERVKALLNTVLGLVGQQKDNLELFRENLTKHMDIIQNEVITQQEDIKGLTTSIDNGISKEQFDDIQLQLKNHRSETLVHLLSIHAQLGDQNEKIEDLMSGQRMLRDQTLESDHLHGCSPTRQAINHNKLGNRQKEINKYYQRDSDDLVDSAFGTGSCEQDLMYSSSDSITVTHTTNSKEERATENQGTLMQCLEESAQQGGANRFNMRQDLKHELHKELHRSKEQTIAGLKEQFQEQRNDFEKMMLQSQARSEAALQEQIQEQQRIFERQMSDMKAMLVAALAAKS